MFLNDLTINPLHRFAVFQNKIGTETAFLKSVCIERKNNNKILHEIILY